MKVSMTALFILMAMAVCSLAFSVPMSIPTTCCFSYIPQPIPRTFVTGYYRTDSMCPKPAVVFKTIKNQQQCANPNEDWVKTYIEDLERTGQGPEQ
uniref:C-C motif chemokine n=1 Tax=Monodelphis domestica TaxID=13616 RepID=F7F990_MONDO